MNVFAFAFWGPLFTVYAVHLGANISLAATLYGAYTGLHAIAILIFGHLDLPRRRVQLLMMGYLGQALAALLFILTERPLLLIIPISMSAIAGGMISPSWKALYTRAIEVGKEGKQWSFSDAGSYGVIAAGTAISGFLANYFGYRSIFIPLGILNLIAAILCFKLPNEK